MAVLTREALESSPLADLHLIARELSIDGFRRLRKADLVDAILDRQDGGNGAAPAAVDEAEAETETETARPRRSRGARGGRSRSRSRTAEEDGSTDEDAGDEPEPEPAAKAKAEPEAEPAPRRSRGRRSRSAEEDRPAAAEGEDRVAEGTVELLGNGSGFLRVSPPDASDKDVYISAAQVRRCELVAGDRVAGPVRPPRRSERFPSLVRIDTINGKPADEVAEGTPYDELAAAWPTERFAFGSEDPTLKAIEWLTPIGRGSRVVLAGRPHSGKSEALRRMAAALQGQEGLEVSLVLAGVWPEELRDWPLEPVAALSFAAPADARAQAIERAADTARRIAARGGHAVLVIDTLEDVDDRLARQVLASARAIPDGGSLTVIATAEAPLGGETTLIVLDEHLTRTGRFPALDLLESGTLRAELLVGEAGAEAIAAARIAATETES